MRLNDWLKIRTGYLAKAKTREEERANLDLSSKDEDIPYYAKVQDEMLMDLFTEIENIKALLTPAPDTIQGEEEGHNLPTIKQRLRLG